MKDILSLATRIIKRISAAGYLAYFAGGWVRDFLLEHPSEDIDIATNAPPHVILDLFPRTIRVGVAFGVVIVDMEGVQFEVATFRKDISYSNGRKPDKVEMSTPEEDALRRDFTINGMFYDPLEDKIYDYVGGMHDLSLGIIRSIGDPNERFREDRLRMIRAVRFSHRFGFPIDFETQEAIKENCESLFPAVALERVWQELSKMSLYASFDGAILMMHRLGLLPQIFPSLQGVHLNEIKHRVTNFHLYPKDTPTLLYILQMFSQLSLNEIFEMCDYLKLSGKDKKLGELWLNLKQFAISEEQNYSPSLYQWTHFYAKAHSDLCLKVYAASLPIEKKEIFLKTHEERRHCLKKHIERIVNRDPLLKSEELRKYGIGQGILMGELLKKGEEISINHNYSDVNLVIQKLKELPLWPK